MKLYNKSFPMLDKYKLNKLSEFLDKIKENAITTDTNITHYIPLYPVISSVEYNYVNKTIYDSLTYIFKVADTVLSKVKEVDTFIRDYMYNAFNNMDILKSLIIDLLAFTNSTVLHKVILFSKHISSFIDSYTNISFDNDKGITLAYQDFSVKDIVFLYNDIDGCEIIKKENGIDYVCDTALTFNPFINININNIQKKVINYLKAYNVSPTPLYLELSEITKGILINDYLNESILPKENLTSIVGTLSQKNRFTYFDNNIKQDYIKPKYVYPLSLDQFEIGERKYETEGTVILRNIYNDIWIDGIQLSLKNEIIPNTETNISVMYINELNNKQITTSFIASTNETRTINFEQQNVQYIIDIDNLTEFTTNGYDIQFPYPIISVTNFEAEGVNEITGSIQEYSNRNFPASGIYYYAFGHIIYTNVNFFNSIGNSDFKLNINYITKPYHTFNISINLSTENIYVSPSIKSISLNIKPCISKYNQPRRRRSYVMY